MSTPRRIVIELDSADGTVRGNMMVGEGPRESFEGLMGLFIAVARASSVEWAGVAGAQQGQGLGDAGPPLEDRWLGVSP